MTMEAGIAPGAGICGSRRTVHVLHIGKTGGSAIKHALSQAPENPSLQLILHSHDTALDAIDPAEPVVFSLREPVGRFVSAFLSRQRCGQPRYFFPWSELEQRVFTAFSTPEELALSLADRSDRHHSLALEAMEGIRHFRRLNKWLGSETFLRSRASQILFVTFQETLNRDFETLRQVLDLPATVSLPTDDVQAHRNPSGPGKQIAAAGQAALNNWYAEDACLIAACRRLMGERGYQPIP
jgi:hypothetical protein